MAGAVSAVQLRLTVLDDAAVPERPLGADGTVEHDPPPLEPAAALTEKFDAARLWPPVQISKPNSTSISHHDGSRLPRDTASSKNGSRFRFVTDVTGVVAT